MKFGVCSNLNAIHNCVFCGGKLPKHKKACPLPGDLQKALRKKVFCPLCGEEVSGDHVCNS